MFPPPGARAKKDKLLCCLSMLKGRFCFVFSKISLLLRVWLFKVPCFLGVAIPFPMNPLFPFYPLGAKVPQGFILWSFMDVTPLTLRGFWLISFLNLYLCSGDFLSCKLNYAVQGVCRRKVLRITILP